MSLFLFCSKTVWNFGILSAWVYGDRELYGMAAKSWGFPRYFSTRGHQMFLPLLLLGNQSLSYMLAEAVN